MLTPKRFAETESRILSDATKKRLFAETEILQRLRNVANALRNIGLLIQRLNHQEHFLDCLVTSVCEGYQENEMYTLFSADRSKENMNLNNLSTHKKKQLDKKEEKII